jgi:hypothetical protein
MLHTSLAPLAAWPQFVAWRIDAGRKLPYSPTTGRLASTTNPANWGTYEQAAAVPGMAGVGFVFTARDPFFFLDIDKALTGGAWSPLAQELCGRLAGACVEVSQSGAGLHVIGSYASLPPHRNKNTPLGIELYTQERFVALTGIGAVGSVTTDHTAALGVIVAQYFDHVPGQVSADWTTGPDPDWSGPADDMQLLEKALRSGGNSAADAFGAGKMTFAELWAADADALGKRWPGNNGAPYDASSADQSLANALAFWTGRDCERTERLMRMSALARAKWDERPDYLETTILKARSLVSTVYQARPDAPPAPPPPPPVTEEQAAASGFNLKGGDGVKSHHDQLNHFAGCVYVASVHKVLTRRGDMLNQGRFDAMYGGFDFVLAVDGGKMTSSAWEAFTQSRTFQPTQADRLCFRPEHGAGGVIIDSGKRLANAYIPAEVDMIAGDPSPFVNHMQRMLPNGDDLELLLSYMASVVQNPGVKMQWWPVVQGTQGNFKSFLLLIMANAVGTHYAHMPNMKKMVSGDSNFNGWIECKLFLGLDEVYAADRREFFEGFKTTVTNRTLPIEGKGVEEVTGDNRANGMIVTNHQDGVPISGEGRRYAPFFCAQQSRADMIRDGMTEDYVADLKDWLLGLGRYASGGDNYGIKIMSHYLHTRAIEARFDPATTVIYAPETSSTQTAITAGLGQLEQDILEAIGEDTPGFCGGWISSKALDALIDRTRRHIPRNKRRAVLQTLGFDWHPALEGTGGRTTSIVAPDNTKPRLFCKVGSIAWNNLTTPADVARAYSEAQTKAMGETTAAAFR